MAQFTGRFMKVWKKEEQNGFIKLDLGDSTKQKDGTYANFTWFGVAVFGKAKDTEVNEGDTIEVKSGIIAKRKYNDKWYDDVKIFEFEVTRKAEVATTKDDIVEIDDMGDSLPF